MNLDPNGERNFYVIDSDNDQEEGEMRDCCIVLCRDATDDEYVRVTVVTEEDGLIIGQAKVSLAKLRNAVNCLCTHDEGAHIVDMRHPD